MPRHSQDQNQDPAASAVGNWKVQVQSPHCIPGMLGSCRHRHQPDAGCCRGELPTKFREIFTFLKTATCPQSYHWQAVLRIFSFSPSDVNMNMLRNFVDSSTAEASIMFQGCCSFYVCAATGCSACSGAAWILDGFHFTFKAGETGHKLRTATCNNSHSQFIFLRTQDKTPFRDILLMILC